MNVDPRRWTRPQQWAMRLVAHHPGDVRTSNVTDDHRLTIYWQVANALVDAGMIEDERPVSIVGSERWQPTPLGWGAAIRLGVDPPPQRWSRAAGGLRIAIDDSLCITLIHEPEPDVSIRVTITDVDELAAALHHARSVVDAMRARNG